jgi:hypothetical protein
MGRKRDDEQHPIAAKIANMGKAALNDDEDTVNAEADELPKNPDGTYKI